MREFVAYEFHRDDHGRGVEEDLREHFPDRFDVAKAHEQRGQQHRMVEQDDRASWAERPCPLQVGACACPILEHAVPQEAARGVPVGPLGRERYRPLGSNEPFGPVHLAIPFHAESPYVIQRLGEFGPGRCMARVERHRPPQRLHRPLVGVTRPARAECPSEQIQVVGFRIGGSRIFARCGQELHLERRHHSVGDLLLDGEDIGELTIELLRPDA